MLEQKTFSKSLKRKVKFTTIFHHLIFATANRYRLWLVLRLRQEKSVKEKKKETKKFEEILVEFSALTYELKKCETFKASLTKIIKRKSLQNLII